MFSGIRRVFVFLFTTVKGYYGRLRLFSYTEIVGLIGKVAETDIDSFKYGKMEIKNKKSKKKPKKKVAKGRGKRYK